nr:ribosome silencing factor [Anaerolineae bacterium]
MEVIDLARFIIDQITDKKGEEIVLLDLRERTIIADYFVICSGTSERQLKAIATGVTEEVKKQLGVIPRSVEGDAATGWVLIDYADVVVHAFAPATRSYYGLEDFWLEHQATVLLKMQ